VKPSVAVALPSEIKPPANAVASSDPLSVSEWIMPARAPNAIEVLLEPMLQKGVPAG